MFNKVNTAANKLQFFPTEEGYATQDSNTAEIKYTYQYKDHLGNVRLSYTDTNGNNAIIASEVIEESNYYPFGLKHGGYNKVVSIQNGNTTAQKWKYNDTEYNDAFSVNMYEVPMRSYDPALARWTTIDPVMHYEFSPYNGYDNNPVFWADPSGADAQVTNYGVTFTGIDAVSAFSAYFKSLESGEGRFTVAGIIFLNAGPGAKFMSMDLAAMDFAMAYNGVSILNNLELASAIYKGKSKGNVYFSYTTPVGYMEFNTDGTRKPSDSTEEQHDVPKGTVLVGHIHTHGADDGGDITRFSGMGAGTQDMERNMINAKRYGSEYRAYVAVPDGSLWKYTPWSPGLKSVTEKISTTIPSDTNSKRRNKPYIDPGIRPQQLPTIISSDKNFTGINLKYE